MDKEGVFEGKKELKTPFIVYVDGGMGHQAQVGIEGNEIEAEPKTTLENTPSANTINAIDGEKLKKDHTK